MKLVILFPLITLTNALGWASEYEKLQEENPNISDEKFNGHFFIDSLHLFIHLKNASDLYLQLPQDHYGVKVQHHLTKGVWKNGLKFEPQYQKDHDEISIFMNTEGTIQKDSDLEDNKLQFRLDGDGGLEWQTIINGVVQNRVVFPERSMDDSFWRFVYNHRFFD